MSFQVTKMGYDPDHLILTLGVSGLIDTNNSSKFRDALWDLIEKNGGLSQVHLDCANLIYLSSTGIGILVDVYSQLKRLNIELRLFFMAESTKNVIKLLGFQNILKIE